METSKKTRAEQMPELLLRTHAPPSPRQGGVSLLPSLIQDDGCHRQTWQEGSKMSSRFPEHCRVTLCMAVASYPSEGICLRKSLGGVFPGALLEPRMSSPPGLLRWASGAPWPRGGPGSEAKVRCMPKSPPQADRSLGRCADGNQDSMQAQADAQQF